MNENDNVTVTETAPEPTPAEPTPAEPTPAEPKGLIARNGDSWMAFDNEADAKAFTPPERKGKDGKEVQQHRLRSVTATRDIKAGETVFVWNLVGADTSTARGADVLGLETSEPLDGAKSPPRKLSPAQLAEQTVANKDALSEEQRIALIEALGGKVSKPRKGAA